MKKLFFFVILFVYVFLNIDLATIRLASIHGVNVYYGDLFFFLILAIAVYMIPKTGIWKTQPVAIWYLVFLTWLGVEALLGMRIYGYRALGESRYVLPYFLFFIPFFLLGSKRRNDTVEVANLFRMTIYISSAAALLFLLCSLIYQKPFYFSEIHVHNQRFWAYKIMDTNQSFFILLLAIFLFLLSFFNKKFISWPKIIFCLLLWVAVPVHNRTALISLMAALLVLLCVEKKFKEIAFVGTSLLIIFALLKWIPIIENTYYPQKKLQLSAKTENRKIPKGLASANWRLYSFNLVWPQIRENIIFGKHLGGYFSYHNTGIKETDNIPPHSAYLYLLLKTGSIGLLLMLVPLLIILWRLFVTIRLEHLEPQEKLTARLLFLVLLAQLPYGLAFGFVSLYAFYVGLGLIYLAALDKKYPHPAIAGK
jgi:hypothetical protein